LQVSDTQSTIAALTKSKLLKNLTPPQMLRVSEAASPHTFRTGDAIVRKGDAGNALFIILEGAVVCSEIGDGDVADVPLAAGDYFGELALMGSGAPRAATVTASEATTCMAIERAAFNRVVGDLTHLLEANALVRTIRTAPSFKHFADDVLEHIVDAAALRGFITVAPGQTYMREGERTNAMVVVASGEVEYNGRRYGANQVCFVSLFVCLLFCLSDPPLFVCFSTSREPVLLRIVAALGGARRRRRPGERRRPRALRRDRPRLRRGDDRPAARGVPRKERRSRDAQARQRFGAARGRSGGAPALARHRDAAPCARERVRARRFRAPPRCVARRARRGVCCARHSPAASPPRPPPLSSSQPPPVLGHGMFGTVRLARRRKAGANEGELLALKVSVLLCTVTFYANIAHSLTRSP
jgi:CRP-like cAMP-binding protein